MMPHDDIPQSRAPRPLPVVFALHDPDGRYWLNTAVAITSLATYASAPIAICVLHDETLGLSARGRLGQIAEQLQVPLTFIKPEIPREMDPARLGRFSPASAFRLMIPTLFADEPLVVYLDSDVVVNGLDIHDLAKVTAAQSGIAAVVDPFIEYFADKGYRPLEALGVAPALYFNSGVLSLRPRLLPRDLPDQFARFLNTRRALAHPDQDFLNCHFNQKAQLLDEKFNTIIGFAARRLVQPLSFYWDRIIHFTSLKPLFGAISPAFIPFFAHAHLVPEIYGGSAYEAKQYLFPQTGNAGTVLGKSIFHDPKSPARNPN